jgi:hypothetical protein
VLGTFGFFSWNWNCDTSAVDFHFHFSQPVNSSAINQIIKLLEAAHFFQHYFHSLRKTFLSGSLKFLMSYSLNGSPEMPLTQL